MGDTIKVLFVKLNSSDGEDIDTAIVELEKLGIIIDRDVYFSWDTI